MLLIAPCGRQARAPRDVTWDLPSGMVKNGALSESSRNLAVPNALGSAPGVLIEYKFSPRAFLPDLYWGVTLLVGIGTFFRPGRSYLICREAFPNLSVSEYDIYDLNFWLSRCKIGFRDLSVLYKKWRHIFYAEVEWLVIRRREVSRQWIF